MNISSPLAKIASVLVSLAVVAGAAQLSVPQAVVQEQGDGGATDAQIGSRFEDMVAGTLTPVVAEDRAAEVKTEAVQEALDVQTAVPVEAPTAEPLKAEALVSLAPSPTAVAAVPLAPPAPTAATPLAAAVPALLPQAIVAQNADNDAPTVSRRPTLKTPDLAIKAAAAQKKTAEVQRKVAKKKAQKAAPKGTAKRNNTQGAKNGNKKKAKAKAKGTKKKKTASKAGNAAASNYPGKVKRRISRQARPRVRAKGTATISFSVTSGGGLARVSVARSSGSSALDRAAVAMVRKAAPFPRPPAGAQRKFRVHVKGR